MIECNMKHIPSIVNDEQYFYITIYCKDFRNMVLGIRVRNNIIAGLILFI